MTRIFSVVALACLVGTAAVSAQMKHVDLKDAKGAVVGMAMISPAKGGGVSIDLDVKGLPPGEHAHALPCGAEVRGAVHQRRRATSTRRTRSTACRTLKARTPAT